MRIDYYDLPFGGQLLLWTTRLIIYGSCRTKPNKYKMIDMAYSKVGIEEGSKLLKPFVGFLRNNKAFKIQPMCERFLIEDEINLIKCIESFKSNSTYNNTFIKIWKLEDEKESFIYYTKLLARSFEKAKLNTNISFSENRFNNFNDNNYNLETRH